MLQWLINRPEVPENLKKSEACPKVSERLKLTKHRQGVTFAEIYNAETEVVKSRIYNLIKSMGEETFENLIAPLLRKSKTARSLCDFYENFSEIAAEEREEEIECLEQEIKDMEDELKSARKELKELKGE